MNKEYAEQYEDNDYKLLQDFNEKKLKLKCLGRTPSKYSSDASGYTQDNQLVNIELKYRDNDINEYDSLHIETHKAYDLLDEYIRDNKIPLYINFLNDGHVVVYNLAKLKHKPYKKRVKTYSKLYQDYESGYKAFLKLEDAYIYKKDDDNYKRIVFYSS